jgi:hypothetical protein
MVAARRRSRRDGGVAALGSARTCPAISADCVTAASRT